MACGPSGGGLAGTCGVCVGFLILAASDYALCPGEWQQGRVPRESQTSLPVECVALLFATLCVVWTAVPSAASSKKTSIPEWLGGDTVVYKPTPLPSTHHFIRPNQTKHKAQKLLDI